MISVYVCIEEDEELNIIILIAHHISKNHTTISICSSIEGVIDNGGLWLERLEIPIKNYILVINIIYHHQTNYI